MTIHIPEWLLWMLGIGIGMPVVAAVLACTYLGGLLIWDSRHD